MFNVIGVLNAFGAVAYEKTQNRSLENSKAMSFDMWQEVGQNLGKLLRYSTDFNEDDEF